MVGWGVGLVLLPPAWAGWLGGVCLLLLAASGRGPPSLDFGDGSFWLLLAWVGGRNPVCVSEGTGYTICQLTHTVKLVMDSRDSCVSFRSSCLLLSSRLSQIARKLNVLQTNK
jgi:hypothetical protein